MRFPFPLWMMTESELREALEVVRALDAALLVQLFGLDGATRYKRLLSKENSPYDQDGARAAYDERVRMELTLDDRQQRLLFGVGDVGVVDVEEVRDYLAAVCGFSAESAAAMGCSLKYAFLKLGERRESRELGYGGRLAYAQVRAGLLHALNEGWDVRLVLAAAHDAIRALYADPEDKEYMCEPLAGALGRDEGAAVVTWLTRPRLLADNIASPPFEFAVERLRVKSRE